MDSQNVNVVKKDYFIDKIQMETNIEFECLVIKPGSISHVPWIDPTYAFKLIELGLCETIKLNGDNFLEEVAKHLKIDSYNIPNLTVKNEIVGEEPYYLYELLYVDLEKETALHTDENLNELASLINVNEDKIYSHAILFRNHLPSLTDSMNLCSVTKNDLGRMLHERVHTKIVKWDENWSEEHVIGDLNVYAECFFDSEPKKLEIPFLMHNINIWYTESIDDGTNKVCGDIIKSPIDKCIWFSMKSDEYRGNISLDEVNKIIFLSKILLNYQTPAEYNEEKTDYLGRKIVQNKYKVLDHMFDKYNKNEI